MLANINAVDKPARLAWFDAALEDAAARCDASVVVCHHPPYSGGNHGDNVDIQELMVPSLVAHGTDTMLSGHDLFEQGRHRDSGFRQ